MCGALKPVAEVETRVYKYIKFLFKLPDVSCLETCLFFDLSIYLSMLLLCELQQLVLASSFRYSFGFFFSSEQIGALPSLKKTYWSCNPIKF